jgi:hypothetical protein
MGHRAPDSDLRAVQRALVKVTGVILCPIPKIRNDISCIEPEVHPKCPLCHGYRFVVFKERLDNKTTMFTGPTHGIY